MCVSNLNGDMLCSHTLTHQHHYSGHQILFFFLFPSTLSPFFNSLSMIQQVIPLDLIPSYLIYTVSFLLSDVVITPTSPAPRRVVPTPAGCCKWRALNA